METKVIVNGKIKKKGFSKRTMVVLSMLAITISLIALEGVVRFASSYRYVGFVKKDNSSWYEIASAAQVDKQDALSDLEQCKKDKAAAIRAANPDLMLDDESNVIK